MKQAMKLGVCGVVFGALGLLTLAGCGDAGGGDEGTAGQAGSTAGAGGNSGAAGGSGGASAASGASGSTAGGGGGAGGTSGCPVVHWSKLVPNIGPWLNGPNPGPCTSVTAGNPNTYEYTYSDGLLMSSKVVNGDGWVEMAEWNGNTVYYVGRTFALNGNHLTMTTVTLDGLPTTEIARDYTLDAQGYPTTVDVDSDEDGVKDATGLYEFTNCRLTRYLLTDTATGTVSISTYTYDAAGNLIARDDETGRVYTWTYDCW